MQSILICKVMVAAPVSATLPAPANDNRRGWGVPTRLANDGWWLAAPPALPRPTAKIHAVPAPTRAKNRDTGGTPS
jgi:hypothetical protein